MNRNFWLLLIMGSTLLPSFQCGLEKEAMPPVKMKLLASFCAHHIVQVQDSAYYDLGITWTNSQGTTYEHVFAVKNHCDFAKAGLVAAQEFMASVVTRAETENCTTCLGFMETPPRVHNLRVERR